MFVLAAVCSKALIAAGALFIAVGFKLFKKSGGVVPFAVK